MNESIKVALGFVVGLAAGSGVTYYILKKNYDQLMNEEVKETKRYYDELYRLELEDLKNKITLLESNAVATKSAEKKEEPKVEKKPAKAKTKDVAVRQDEKYKDVVKVDYNTISSKEPENKVTSKSTKTKGKKTEPEKAKGPEIITFEEYTADRKHEKVMVTYLDREDMVLDENNEPIECAEDMLGEEFKDFDFSEDGRCVYVRNDSIGKDFEVVIDVYNTYDQFLIEERD